MKSKTTVKTATKKPTTKLDAAVVNLAWLWEWERDNPTCYAYQMKSLVPQ